MKPTVRRADVRVASHFAANLRPADRRELQAAHPNKQIIDILRHAIASGDSYVAGFEEGNYWCVLFGVVPGPGGLGIIWMVCTPGIKGHAIAILREARHWITCWKHQYDVLANYVEVRNTSAWVWLKALGAYFGPPEQRNGEAVLPFYL